jgi:hypothetical protein
VLDVMVMAMDLPLWALKAIDKIRSNFLWRGQKEADGGHCLVAWHMIQAQQNQSLQMQISK